MKRIIQVGKPDPKKIKFVEFTIEKEPWNTIRVKDKSIIKNRFILTQVITDKTMIQLEKELKEDKN